MAKKKAKKAGRPPKPDAERQDVFVTVRFAPEDHEVLTQACEAADRKIRPFVREAAIEKARRVLGRE